MDATITGGVKFHGRQGEKHNGTSVESDHHREGLGEIARTPYRLDDDLASGLQRDDLFLLFEALKLLVL